MSHIRRTTAALGTAALLAAPLTLMTATPASAAEREFRYAGAEFEFEAEKDDGRFEVELDVDAKRGTKWQITLTHDGKRYYNKTRTPNRDGDIEIAHKRPDTAGKDVFTVHVKKVGQKKGVSRTITLR